MEFFFRLLGYVFGLLISLWPLWLLLLWITRRKRRVGQAPEPAVATPKPKVEVTQEEFGWLIEQVAGLAARIERLEQEMGVLPSLSPPLERPVGQPLEPAVAPLAPEVEEAQAWAQLIAERPVAPRPDPVQEAAEAEAAMAAAPHSPPTVPQPPPTPKARERLSAALQRSGADVADWETLIGGKWLNKIGIVVFVIGVALFLGYSLRYMGPLGRVATGLVTSLILLIGGVTLERIEKYSLFAKPLIGGGWALLYFTGYAAHSIEVSKIIHDPIHGIVLLGVIAGGMILHSLKYRSQIVTGIAYFLGFLTVAISPLTGFSLVASAILAGSLVAILRGTAWSALGLFGVAATYLNHLLWLEYRIGGPAQLVPTDSFWIAQGMLALYWLLFTAFDFLLKPEDDGEEKIGFAINLANTVAFLGLSYRQVGIVFPDARYLLTGLTAVAYVASSSLLRQLGRHKLHLINASVAIVLLAVTFPLKLESVPLGQYWLAIAWLVEAAVVLTLGLYLNETVFRVHSYLLSTCGLGALFLINLYGQPEPPHLLRWITVSPGIAYFYYLFGQLHNRWRQGAVREEEQMTGVFSGYVASMLLVLLLWKEVRLELVGLAWLAAGLLLVEAGIRFRQDHLRRQAYVLSALTLTTLFLVNLFGLFSQQEFYGLSRWMILPPAIFAFYSLFSRLQQAAVQGRVQGEERWLGDLSSYAASALLAVLLWQEVRLELVGLAWLAAGLLLVEAGIRFRQLPLRIQGYGFSALATTTFFLVNLYGFYGQQDLRGLSRWIILPPAILGFSYLFWRLHRVVGQGRVPGEERSVANSSSYAASALLTVLLWKELDPVAVSLAWGFLGLVLFEAGVGLHQTALRVQGHALAALAFGRLFLANFTAPGEFIGLSHRLITVVPIVAIFYYLLARVRGEETPRTELALERYLPQVYSYAAAVLLVVLARFEFSRALAVIGWAVIGLVLLILGIFWRDRDLRIQSCLIAILTVWRSWSTNFFLIGSVYGIPERLATTVPVIALLFVSQLLCLYRRGLFPKAEEARSGLARLDANAQWIFSILGSFLLAILLFYEVRGNLLTMAWTIQGLVLMAAGFLLRERTLRLSGLGLFAVCLLKVFVIDLRGLETIYRILSFIVLGIILLLVSFAYTKYKDVIKRYI